MSRRLLPIISILILIALLLGGYFLWLPQYRKYKEAKVTLKEKTEQLKQKIAYFDDLARLSKKMKKKEEEIRKITTSLPKELSQPSIYNYFQKVAPDTGMMLESINVGKVEKKTTAKNEGAKLPSEVKKVPISLSVSGRYFAFKNFLSKIYRCIRFFDIDSVSFSASKSGSTAEVSEGTGSQGNFYQFSLSLKTYVFSGGEEISLGEDIPPEAEEILPPEEIK